MRRLDEKKLVGKSIKAVGIEGLRSDQIIPRHKGTINNEPPETNKVIIYIASNDVAKGVPPEKIVDNVESAGKRVVQVNSKVKVAISAIFLQGSELAENNLNILRRNYCVNYVIINVRNF